MTKASIRAVMVVFSLFLLLFCMASCAVSERETDSAPVSEPRFVPYDQMTEPEAEVVSAVRSGTLEEVLGVGVPSPLRCALRIDEEEVRYGILSPYSYKFYKEDTQLRYLGEIYPGCGEPYVTPEHPLQLSYGEGNILEGTQIWWGGEIQLDIGDGTVKTYQPIHFVQDWQYRYTLWSDSTEPPVYFDSGRWMLEEAESSE